MILVIEIWNKNILTIDKLHQNQGDIIKQKVIQENRKLIQKKFLFFFGGRFPRRVKLQVSVMAARKLRTR